MALKMSRENFLNVRHVNTSKIYKPNLKFRIKIQQELHKQNENKWIETKCWKVFHQTNQTVLIALSYSTQWIWCGRCVCFFFLFMCVIRSDSSSWRLFGVAHVRRRICNKLSMCDDGIRFQMQSLKKTVLQTSKGDENIRSQSYPVSFPNSNWIL